MSVTTFDRAAVVMGTASIASVVFGIEGLGDFRFVWLSGVSIVVALVLGLLALLAGALARPALAIMAGIAFVAAAIVQVVSAATGNDWLGADLAATSLWLGLGVGLLVVGSVPRET